ncbi:hypothetical protein ANCCEY_04772 [Ancylostoma ceylanicum]|uniref:Mos1 transposase HTH domain-containing protein n=2 Tax=Ancylostoma ceylanicum TaxID=53326 RepID=A0A0D6M179_9BILA|nr:hypothetical protein ANCCEY_04772 [Ancylostoma ceylanicum]EYC39100.1 hypothetical protein Y032_0676g1434 [Ancylostoma ceylanicum]
MASISQVSLRSIVYYEFLQRHPARCAATNICATFKEDVIRHSTVSRWYKHFESGDITLEGRPRSGRPTIVNDNDLQDALKARPEADAHMLAKTLDCDQATIVKHFHGLGYSKIVSIWVPHELRGSDKACRVRIVESLFLRPHRKDFLKDIVTGDESWSRTIHESADGSHA